MRRVQRKGKERKKEEKKTECNKMDGNDVEQIQFTFYLFVLYFNSDKRIINFINYDLNTMPLKNQLLQKVHAKNACSCRMRHFNQAKPMFHMLCETFVVFEFLLRSKKQNENGKESKIS